MFKLVKNLTKFKNIDLNFKKISSTSILNDIFTLQDYDDYQKRVLQNDKLVILDFYADWCNPCKTLGPRLETVLIDNKDIDLAKINVDNFDIPESFEVTSLPTVYAIKNGRILNRFVGVRDEDEIRAFIANNKN